MAYGRDGMFIKRYKRLVGMYFFAHKTGVTGLSKNDTVLVNIRLISIGVTARPMRNLAYPHQCNAV